MSYTLRPRSSFRKATGCPGIANVGSDRSTNSLTRTVTRSCLGVGTESAANGPLDPEHHLRLEMRALTSSSRLLSRDRARTCLRPCGRGPNSRTRGDGKMPHHWPGSQSLRRCRQASSPPFLAAQSLGGKCSFSVSTISSICGRATLTSSTSHSRQFTAQVFEVQFLAGFLCNSSSQIRIAQSMALGRLS